MQKVENTGMATTIDIGECDNIHPGEKQKVGERLALWAFANDYGIKGIDKSGPVFDIMNKDLEGKLRLSFKYAPQGFATRGDHLSGFQIAGKDKVFHEAKAKIDFREPVIIVWSEKVENPVAVRYGFEDCPKATLFDIKGLPASSFRTDSWD